MRTYSVKVGMISGKVIEIYFKGDDALYEANKLRDDIMYRIERDFTSYKHVGGIRIENIILKHVEYVVLDRDIAV